MASSEFHDPGSTKAKPRALIGSKPLDRRVQAGLVLALLLVVGAHYVLTRDADFAPALKVSEPQLAPELSRINFGDIELTLADLQFSDAGTLRIDASTESVLSVASQEFDLDTPASAKARARFLIQQLFPEPQATQVINLFERYLAFNEARIHWRLEHTEPTSLQEEIKQFEAMNELQDKTLGKNLADQLFNEQRRLERMMLESRVLDADTSLSPEEKQNRLQALHAEIFGADDAE